MRFAILELSSSNHYSLIESWILCLKELGHEVTLFTDSNTYESVSLDKIDYELTLKQDDETVTSFLNRAERTISSSCDYVIITSMQSRLIAHLLFNPKCRIILTIHNARTWFEGNQLISLKNIVKRLIRWVWKKRAWAFSVSSDNIRKYIRSNFWVNKEILVMPFSIVREEASERIHNSKKVLKKVTFPGMLSTKRKRYDRFFSLAKNYPDVEFVLLGKPNIREGGKDVLEKAEAIGNVKVYEEFIPTEEFEEELNSSELLFTDMHLNFKKEDYWELYGETKDTGITYLMINHRLPCLINASFSNIEALQKTTIYFEDMEDLFEKFNFFYKKPTQLNKMYLEAQLAAEKFSSQIIAKTLKKYLK